MARPTRAETRAETRRRLIRAAAQLFARRGYEAASVEEICELAGYSTGAVYSNFDGKEDLFLTVLGELLTERTRATMKAFESAESFEDQIDLVKRWFGYETGEDQEWLLLTGEFWLYAARHPDTRERLAGGYEWLRETIARLIEKHWDRKPPSESVPLKELASVVLALQNGLAQQRLLDPEHVSRDALSRAIYIMLGRTPPES